MSKLTLTLPDTTLDQVDARAAFARKPPEIVGAQLLQAALAFMPEGGGRLVVVSGPILLQLEEILGGGSLLNGDDLAKKVARLAGVSFQHVRLPFTPNQLELLAEKAQRNGLTVQTLVERTAPRIYEQFFDLIARSS